VLAEVFDLHPLAIRACVERNAVPKVRAYRDHVFVVLHAPELGQGGHVHHVGLDQFIGPHYIEYDKARTDTKVTIAAERLALIAVLTLPITALSSVYGMNIIVNDQTDFAHLAVVLAAMIAISAVLLRWAKQQGWW
jgi:Mg2+ and Co2+ transporter CorA